MKLRYKIVIVHLLLYLAIYLTLIIYYNNAPAISWSEFPEKIIEIIKQLIFILLAQTCIPVIGVLFGFVKKNKEIKDGFFIATINAVVVNLLAVLSFYYKW